jgi:hypothetical protein
MMHNIGLQDLILTREEVAAATARLECTVAVVAASRAGVVDTFDSLNYVLAATVEFYAKARRRKTSPKSRELVRP